MKREHIAVKILFLFMLTGISTGEVCYGAEFSEDVWPCADFDNEKLRCDSLQLGMVEGKEAELGLNGVIEVNEAIEEGAKMIVEIWKILDIGKEYLYHVEGDICSSLKNENTPWYPMINSMKIEKCPISANSYNIKDMSINLNNSKGLMNHEMCGEYILRLSTKADSLADQLSCYELSVIVTENEC